MAVAMTDYGEAGWVADSTGYRYDPVDPDSQRAWPDMPELFLELAVRASELAGYPGFMPDACLVNRYVPGARLSLHQDRDEIDLSASTVSVSPGLPATFLWGACRDRTSQGACVPFTATWSSGVVRRDWDSTVWTRYAQASIPPPAPSATT